MSPTEVSAPWFAPADGLVVVVFSEVALAVGLLFVRSWRDQDLDILFLCFAVTFGAIAGLLAGLIIGRRNGAMPWLHWPPRLLAMLLVPFLLWGGLYLTSINRETILSPRVIALEPRPLPEIIRLMEGQAGGSKPTEPGVKSTESTARN